LYLFTNTFISSVTEIPFAMKYLTVTTGKSPKKTKTLRLEVVELTASDEGTATAHRRGGPEPAFTQNHES